LAEFGRFAKILRQAKGQPMSNAALPMKLAIAGAGGRMGRELARIVHATPGCVLAGGLEAPGSAYVGVDFGTLFGVPNLGIKITDKPEAVLPNVDGIIDFTVPAATLALLKHTSAFNTVHVIGTTGIDSAGEATIKWAAEHAVIVKSGNMSLGVNLLAGLVKKVAATLGEDFDIEVLEMHHNKKIDAPSGTALLLGKAAADGRAVALEKASVRVRDGHTGARVPGTIGFATLRGGTVVGDHTVMFAGASERIELSHKAESREIFARGAVRAAMWAKGQKPGLYDMNDVLGLN
jgi:4-hydroxy-tetrahydrodipicolinate reductase